MILITKTEAIATSDKLTFKSNPSDPQGAWAHKRFPLSTTFKVIGVLGPGEYIRLDYHDGDDWRPLNIEGDGGIILDENNAVETVYGSLINCRLYKTATPGNPVGVGVL